MGIRNMIAMLKEQGLADFYNSLQGTPASLGDSLVVRRRVTLAEINAGTQIIPPVPSFKWRVSDMRMIAVGGAVGGATLVRITGTAAAATVALLGVAIAALTQSTVVRAGAANATVLADGASFTELDVNTGISVDKTGGAATTATAVDVEMLLDIVPEV
jgi:hypothetical protein